MKKESEGWYHSNRLFSRIVVSVKSLFFIEYENLVEEKTQKESVGNEFNITIYDNSYAEFLEIFEEYNGIQSEEGLGRELLRAATQGDIKKVRKLLESGVSPNIDDEKGNTAILEAARKDDAKLYRLLLSYGADQKVTNKFGHSIITHVQNNIEIGKDEIFLDFLCEKSKMRAPTQQRDIESEKIGEHRDNHSMGM